MRFDAKTENWEQMTIRGVKGWFSDMRIDRSTVPDEFHFWELGDGNSDGNPCRYSNGIAVDFYGTFITKGDLPIDEPQYTHGFINSKKDIWHNNRFIPFSEVIEYERQAV